MVVSEISESSTDDPESKTRRTALDSSGPRRLAQDTDDFVEFYRRETPALVTFLRWFGARLADAADVTQETMIDLYRSWPTIEHPRKWTRTVASRKFVRMCTRTDTPATISDGGPLLPGHIDVSEWEQKHEILRLLDTLPPRQRQVMAWTFDGYEPSEIAAELQITPEAVRGSLKLARRSLAMLLAENGDDPA